MVVKSTKVHPVVTGRRKVKAVVNELIQIFKNERSNSTIEKQVYYSPNLHWNFTQIAQNRGENDDFENIDEIVVDEFQNMIDIKGFCNKSRQPVLIQSKNIPIDYQLKVSKADYRKEWICEETETK